MYGIDQGDVSAIQLRKKYALDAVSDALALVEDAVAAVKETIE